MILKAFENGADGVMVIGCLEGDCHYTTGNLRARKRVEHTAGILEQAGIGGERVRMYNLSAGEGASFAKYADEMFEHVQVIGPSPINIVRSGGTVAAKKEAEEMEPDSESPKA